jgi:hypothetical protein
MTMTKQSSTLFSSLAALADEIKAPTKKASDATPGTDPGGITGASTHPSADAASDNGSQAASEGSRSSENEKDVKAQIGAPGVNSGSGANTGSNSQDNAQLNIGATQSATGEDPKVEDAYKDKLPDPGTTHPAQVGKEKYSSMKIAELQARATELGNAVLADIANGFLPAKQAAAPAAPANTAAFDQLSQEIEKAAALVQQHVGNNPEAAAQMAAGYQLASSLKLTKEAAQRKVAEVVEAALADGYFDADLFGAAYKASLEQVKQAQTKPAAQKRAAGEEAEGNDHDRPGDSDSGKSPAGGEDADAPMAGGGGGGGGGGLSAMLGGGGGGPDAGAAPSKEEILQEILSALAELGIPLDELAAAGAGGAPGGAPGGPAGGPPGGAPLPPPDAAMMGGGGGMPPDEGMKLAAAARAFQRSGKYQLKTANPGSRERHLRDDLKKYILEIPGIRK